MEKLEAIKISERVYWVGAIDWGIRDFHGYSTSRGTTYNAFLILGEEPILIDTVKEPFFEEMMSRIASLIDPKAITYIISNHAEMDHSGALPRAIEAINPKKVFASNMGVSALKAHFHFDFEITEVQQDIPLLLGDAKFLFLETKMLHWPDSMFTYFVNDKILFSQDAFGQHFATTQLFADAHDYALLKQEAAKYYANILMPFSPLVKRLLSNKFFNELAIDIIAPDHGPLWRHQKDIERILGLYREWSQKPLYKKVVIVYDTMWKSTSQMAEAIADGVMSKGLLVTLCPLSSSHRSDIATELLEAGALLVGTPTLNQQMFPTVADMFCYIQGLKPTYLLGQAFGSYGWGGEGARQAQLALKEMGVSLIGKLVTSHYVPTDDVLENCRQLGKQVAIELLR